MRARISFLVLVAAFAAPARAQQRQLIPPAELGVQLLARFGCAGCHAGAGGDSTGTAKAGPDLRRIAAKTTPAWALEWVMAPRRLRPTTWMPHFFAEGDRGEARAIVAYLWERSLPADYPPPPAGDPGRGADLWRSVGCTGCHLMEAGVKRHGHPRPQRLQGPNLLHLGDKVNAAWLFAWLRSPRRVAPQTPMPDLRLTDREAADLTAFLMASRDPGRQIPAPAPASRGDVAAGREAIESYGCYGCHLIAGFEDAGPHASPWTSAEGFMGHGMAGLPDFDLSAREIVGLRAATAEDPGAQPPALAAGRRLIARLNCRGCHLIEGAGHAIEATIDDPGLLPPNLRGEGSRVQPQWLAAYLAEPGSVVLRGWLGVRMPDFGLSEHEIGTLVAYFAALEDRELALEPAAAPAARSIALGREAFDLMPCGRCHPMSADAAKTSDLDLASLAPPLDVARRRLRYEWIGLWLQDPQGWLPGTKMPTFFMQTRPGVFHSPFQGALGSPLFAEPRARMLEHLASEAELEAFLDDAGAVIAAIRDYVWSLGEAPAHP